jgi:hypothetical protein
MISTLTSLVSDPQRPVAESSGQPALILQITSKVNTTNQSERKPILLNASYWLWWLLPKSAKYFIAYRGIRAVVKPTPQRSGFLRYCTAHYISNISVKHQKIWPERSEDPFTTNSPLSIHHSPSSYRTTSVNLHPSFSFSRSQMSVTDWSLSYCLSPYVPKLVQLLRSSIRTQCQGLLVQSGVALGK